MKTLTRTLYWTPSMFVAIMLARQGWSNTNIIIAGGELWYKMELYEVENEGKPSIEKDGRDVPYSKR